MQMALSLLSVAAMAPTECRAAPRWPTVLTGCLGYQDHQMQHHCYYRSNCDLPSESSRPSLPSSFACANLPGGGLTLGPADFPRSLHDHEQGDDGDDGDGQAGESLPEESIRKQHQIN